MIATILWMIPWLLPLTAVLVRVRRSRSLDEFTSDAPPDAPLVSVVVPARNEARNIERCVRSILASTYPSLEVIVVDDHSTDGTGDLARAIARADPRLQVIDAPPLPDRWFGKQWACAAGAARARGALLVFTDADTRHAPDLVPRAVNALGARSADLLSVAGRQEMHSFWERVIQPHLFILLALRYGSTEHVSNARRPEDAIANGQFILVRGDAYDAMGGHEAVRDRVAEDMSLAQNWVRAGRRIALFLALEQLSTHMYASLGEIVAGWRKNIYAGGRHAALGGRIGRASYPLFLLAAPLLGLAPLIVAIVAVLHPLSDPWLIWSMGLVAASVVFWSMVYRFLGESAAYAFTYPIGFAMLGYIAIGSVARGRRVRWKDRSYLTN